VTLCSLDVFEKPLAPSEINAQEQIDSSKYDKQTSPANQPVNNDPNEYDFKPKVNESWIAVLDDLSTKEFIIGFPAPKVIVWVKKLFDHQFDPNVMLFNYEFYSGAVNLMKVKVGTFICVKAYDVCQKTGYGNHCTIHFELADRNNIIRNFDCGEQGAQGIVSILKFMYKVSAYIDWNSWDSMIELLKSGALTEDDLAAMMKELLTGTGIILK